MIKMSENVGNFSRKSQSIKREPNGNSITQKHNVQNFLNSGYDTKVHDLEDWATEIIQFVGQRGKNLNRNE